MPPNCKLHLDFFGFQHFVSFGFQKSSPYTQLFSWHMAKAKESGLFNRIREKYVSTKGSLCNPPAFQPVAIDNVFTPFVTLLLGISFSIIIVVMEWCRKRRVKSKPMNDSKYADGPIIT